MAPPTLTTTTKGTNPAPDYNLLMNKIALTFGQRTDSLELMRQHRASAAAISAKTAPKATTSSNDTGASTSGTFSSLQKTTTTNANNTKLAPSSDAQQQQDPNSQANLVAEAAQFALEHGAAPNAGIGFAPHKKLSDHDGTPGFSSGGDMTQENRSTQALRARLLGRKGVLAARRGDADAAGAARRKKYGGRTADSSEDDEPGRSGLGREKKKRRRSESEGEAEEQELREDEVSAKKRVGSIEASTPRQEPDRPESTIDENADVAGTGMSSFVIASHTSTVSEEGRKKKKKKKQKRTK